MPDQEKESEPGSFFDDFGPMHELWIRLERGMQIMLGVALITMFGFLGESWGGENIPYPEIMKGVYRVSWAFAVSIMTSPAILLLGLAAARVSSISRRARGRIYFVVLMAMLVYCFTLLYISTIDVMQSLVAATGVDPLM